MKEGIGGLRARVVPQADHGSSSVPEVGTASPGAQRHPPQGPPGLASRAVAGDASRRPRAALPLRQAAAQLGGREQHPLNQAQAQTEIPAARQGLAGWQQRLPAAAQHRQDAQNAMPADRLTLGSLLTEERRERTERARLLNAALPRGGAAMQRLAERAARQHPATQADRWRARLRGGPRAMEGGRREAFEALVRTDVLALAKTGRMEPRLAAGLMRSAVMDGTLGQDILVPDRQLLLDVLDKMAEGGTPPPPLQAPAGTAAPRAEPPRRPGVPPQPGQPLNAAAVRPSAAVPDLADRYANDRLPPVPRPPGARYAVTVSMLKRHAGEEGGTIWGTSVTYLDAQKRQQYQLHMHDGKLFDAQGKLFDTRQATSTFSDCEGKAIFVMDPMGNIYASNHQVIGKFHHSSFLAGAPVAAAGEMEVHDGVVQSISRQSGHYRPTALQLLQMEHNLRSQGAAGFSVNQNVIAP